MQVLTDPSALTRLTPSWDQLRTDVPGPTTHLDWVLAHAEVIPPEERLCGVAVFDEGRVVALAPLVESCSWPHRLRWLDTGDISSVFYLDERHLADLARAIYRLRRPLTIDAFVPGSLTDTALREQRPRGWIRVVRPWVGVPALAIDDTWDDPVAKLGKKRRSEQRRTLRKAQSRGEVTFEVLTPSPGEAFEELFEEFVRLESAGWKAAAGTALAQDRQQREGLRRYLMAAAASGSFRITRMCIDHAPVAIHLNVVGASRLWGLKGAVDDTFKAVSPGLHLFAFTIGVAAEEGLEGFEFMGATAPFKEMWGAVPVELHRYQLYPPTPAGGMALATDLARKGVKEASRRYRKGRARASTKAPTGEPVGA